MSQTKKEKSLAGIAKKLLSAGNIVYFSFFILYFYWVLTTYRNIVHMDMMTIISTKLVHLLEHRLTIQDFIYQPLFPTTISLVFTFINAGLFHLNTVLETIAGSVFLFLLGYKYLNSMSRYLRTGTQKILFAILISFILFGLHKWEAAFTSFFSFAVFFTLYLCFLNYFFAVNYIRSDYPKKKRSILSFLVLNLLILIEVPAYFYAYILAIIIILCLARYFRFLEIDKSRWKIVLSCSIALLVITLGLTAYLSKDPRFMQYASSVSLSGFFDFFIHKPFWVIKFYLIAQSGAFLGEAYNLVDLRALAGILILLAYALVIYKAIKNRDGRLLVPIAFILYNLISCGMIVMGRYGFNALEYGSSSRYSVYNMSGVLGLVTILFFFIADYGKNPKKYMAYFLLAGIIAGYIFVDINQLEISPSRTQSFSQIRSALLTGENLDVLQADKTTSLNAIKILKQYNLNVYYDKSKNIKSGIVKLDPAKPLLLIVGTPGFNELDKSGFYENENGAAWTNGNASVFFDQQIEIMDSLIIEMNTYMPVVCKNVIPKLSFYDEAKKQYLPARSDRIGDKFYFFFDGMKGVRIQKINIVSETINALPDLRILSFPFKGLEIRSRIQ